MHYKVTISPTSNSEDTAEPFSVIVVAPNRAQALRIATAKFVTIEGATPDELIAAGKDHTPVLVDEQ